MGSRKQSKNGSAGSNAQTDSSNAAATKASKSTKSKSSPALSPLEQVESNMTPLLSTPSLFFSPSATHVAACVESTKLLYDLSKQTAPSFLTVGQSVPKLLTHTSYGSTTVPFTSDQIYAQLSLHSTPLLQRIEQQVKVLQQHVKQQQAEQKRAEQQEDEDEQGEDDEEQDGEDEDDIDAEERAAMDAEMDEDEDEEDQEEDEAMEDEDEDEEGAGGEGGDDDEDADLPAGEFKGRGGITEDAFFSLDDMEKFADMYENDEDYGEIENDEDGEAMEDDENGEDDEDEEEEEDDELDVAALQRQAIRKAHNAKLKPMEKPEDVDLEEEVGDIDLKGGEKYQDFFDAPPEELLGGRGKGGKKKKSGSLLEQYAQEDEEEYEGDDDMMDEFGGNFKKLSTSAREGMLGKATVEGKKVRDEAAAASSSGAGEQKEEDNGPMSSYEKQSRKLKEQISNLEAKIVQPREWSQLGEVSGKARPVDSLLNHHLEFEHAGKISQPVTQEYTEELEVMIKRRIQKEDFNDVKRVYESELTGRKKKSPAEELNQEKSAVGLAEVYEQEFLATKAAEEGRPSASQEKIDAAHEEIAGLVGALFHKLDALCNFHFTPRHVNASELEISAKPNVSAIALEENIPVHMSSAAHVAPQEVYDVSQNAMIGETERVSEEKKSRRRRIKAQRKKAFDKSSQQQKDKLGSMARIDREGDAEAGIVRKAISQREITAAVSARNVISAGGGGAAPTKKSIATPHGQNTKFSNSSAFFGKMQSNHKNFEQNKKQKVR